MANIIKIPANSQAYLTAVRDALNDKFDILGMEFKYMNPVAFPPAWGYWKMEEDGGDRVDATGNGRNLVQTDSLVPRDTGKLGYGAKFPGDNGTLQNLDTQDKCPDLTGNVKWTYSFWVKVHRLATGAADLYLQTGGSGNMDADLSLGAGSSDPYFWAETPVRYVETPTFSQDVFHLIVLYYDGAALKLDLDNVNVASDSGPSSITSCTHIGWGGIYPNNKMSVVLDEKGFWLGDDALTADQRAQLWNGGAGWSPY